MKLRSLSPGTRVNARYINSTRGTFSFKRGRGAGGGGGEGGVFDFKDTTGRDYISLYLLLCQVRVPAADSGPCCCILSANEFLCVLILLRFLWKVGLTRLTDRQGWSKDAFLSTAI